MLYLSDFCKTWMIRTKGTYTLTPLSTFSLLSSACLCGFFTEPSTPPPLLPLWSYLNTATLRCNQHYICRLIHSHCTRRLYMLTESNIHNHALFMQLFKFFYFERTNWMSLVLALYLSSSFLFFVLDDLFYALDCLHLKKDTKDTSLQSSGEVVTETMNLSDIKCQWTQSSVKKIPRVVFKISVSLRR